MNEIQEKDLDELKKQEIIDNKQELRLISNILIYVLLTSLIIILIVSIKSFF